MNVTSYVLVVLTLNNTECYYCHELRHMQYQCKELRAHLKKFKRSHNCQKSTNATSYVLVVLTLNNAECYYCHELRHMQYQCKTLKAKLKKKSLREVIKS